MSGTERYECLGNGAWDEYFDFECTGDLSYLSLQLYKYTTEGIEQKQNKSSVNPLTPNKVLMF